MDVKGGGRRKREKKEGGGDVGVFVPRRVKEGGEREPDVQEIEAKQVRRERHKK